MHMKRIVAVAVLALTIPLAGSAAYAQTAYETLTTYLAEHSLDLSDIMTEWALMPPDVFADYGDYFVIDVRSDSLYKAGHIPGAVRSSFVNLLTTARQAGDKPILVVCKTGQGAGFAAVALRLSGYTDAKVAIFGMSIWNAEFDVWSSGTSSVAVGHANWTTDAAATPETFADPEITTSQTDGEALLAERVQLLLDNGPRMVTGGTVLENPSDYFVNVYWPADTLTKYGHIAGAYNIVGDLSIDGGGLSNLDPADTIVTYCYTGQAGAFVTAYLNVLGFDARFMAFGANGMIYSELESSRWPGPQDKPCESGSPYELLTSYLDNHDLDLTDIYFSGGKPSWIIAPSAVNDAIDAKADSLYVMDIRPDSAYQVAHIPGAVNVKLGDVVDSAANAGTKPIVVACHTGQGAAYAVTALRLSGYANARSMKWGMSAWCAKADVWTSHTGDAADGEANWTTDAVAEPDTFEHPEFATGTMTDSAAVLRERVAAMLAGGPGTLPNALPLAKPGAYQLNAYFTPDSVDTYGHFAGSYNMLGAGLNIGGGGLVHLDAGRTVVTYCWTGQMAAAVSAYLKVLGYDSRFVVFGLNGLVYGDLPDGPYKWSGPADFEAVDVIEVALPGRQAPDAVGLRPVAGGVELSLPAEGGHVVELFDLGGTRLARHTLDGAAVHVLSTPHLAAGKYLLEVAHGGELVSRSLVIAR